jgi:hypothetical protein
MALSGKTFSVFLPDPFIDANGVVWFYDMDFGWTNREQLQKIMDYFKPTIEGIEGIEGIPIIYGTGGKSNSALSDMFYNPENYGFIKIDEKWDDLKDDLHDD